MGRDAALNLLSKFGRGTGMSPDGRVRNGHEPDGHELDVRPRRRLAGPGRRDGDGWPCRTTGSPAAAPSGRCFRTTTYLTCCRPRGLRGGEEHAIAPVGW